MRGGSCRNHPRLFVVGSGVIVDLYTSAFCEPCHLTRAVLDAEIVERDIVAFEAQAEVDGIRVTPTVIVRGADGVEVLRAEGVPTVPQVLAAFAKAL